MKCVLKAPFALVLASILAWSSAQGSVDRGHSHNDYLQTRPLEDALSYSFTSVEVDVWLKDGGLRVGHYPWDDEGSLQELYLDPLQRRVDVLGSVLGDGRPFTLWIDLKSSSSQLPSVLRRILSSYPMLTIFTDYQIEHRPVTVVLTGNARAKRETLEGFPYRHACRDQDALSSQDPPADLRWLWYAIAWSQISSWNGQGRMPDADRVRLQELVARAHQKGRKLRLWHTPETVSYWAEALSAGVDLIGSDRLPELAAFLDSVGESP